METTVTKQIRGKKMETLFDKSKIVNIRGYYPVDMKDNYVKGKEYLFNIVIRHNEDENPEELLNEALNLLE